jgi:hypothetical protein
LLTAYSNSVFFLIICSLILPWPHIYLLIPCSYVQQELTDSAGFSSNYTQV